MTDEFGWPRRNAFIQPQVDAVMYEGLQRFPHVRCLFSREVEAFSQSSVTVTLHLKGPAANAKRCRPTGWSPATAEPALFAAR
jgi:3-(3-hydroxy-phenyl)propionate hydroxylase